jgi:hypothetical protein
MAENEGPTLLCKSTPSHAPFGTQDALHMSWGVNPGNTFSHYWSGDLNLPEKFCLGWYK